MTDLVNRLMTFTGDGVYRYTFEDGRILFANAGLVRILDLDCAPEELAGKLLKDALIYTEKAGAVRATLEETGEVHGFEYHFKTLKGEERWVIHDSFIVTDPQTGERIVEAIVKDITARKRAERALADERERLVVTLRSIGDAVIAVDVAGAVREINPVAEHLTGWSAADALGKPLAEVFRIVNEDTGLPVESPVVKVLREGKVVGLANHTALLSRDGRRIAIADSGAPIRGLDGRVVGVVMVFRDVTEQRKAERELARMHSDLARRVRERTSELTKANILLQQQVHERRVADQRHSLMLQAALDGFWVTDGQGRFLEVNEAYCRMIGYSRSELLRMRIHDIEATEAFETTEQHIQQIIQTGSDRFETRHRHKDGTVIEVEASATHMTEDGGRFVVFLRDVTQRKLEAERLARTLADLQQSNRELEQFAYVASHDLQEPLRKIDAFAERLRTKCGPQLTADGLDYLMRVQSASARMGRLITDLLAYSRITTRAKPWESVDLNRVAGEVVADLEVRIQQAGARVTVGPLPTLDADATQMRQFLQNLIGNALKFRKPDTAPEIEVSSRPCDGETPPGRCEITVKDNGIGFDEKYAERIFEIFQRLHARDEYEGSGIGLAVCRKIVQRHGGSIAARGASGAGATFTAVLPLRQTETSAAP
jgi:PAS domain S-box-containing protein